MSIFKDQAAFMQAGGQITDKSNMMQSVLYESLVDEEYGEFYMACENPEPQENRIKEAIDLIVVTAGWLISQGIDAQKAWDIVHANNLAKVQDVTVKNAEGKIQKSEASIKRKAEMMLALKGLC